MLRTTPRTARFAVAAVSLTSLIALAGCATASPAATEASSTPVAGGVLSVGLTADPGCLDPQQTSQLTTFDIARGIVDTLTDQDPKTGEIEPWLASSFTVSDDAREFTFTLRDGVTFSDGTVLDATAVKSTFDFLSTLPPSGPASYIRGYTGTTITDPLTFTVGFESPNAQFLQATSTVGFGILSPATAQVSLEDRCRGEFVGSGPFVLDSYTANQDVSLTKRADYAWPSSLAQNQGAAYLDGIDYVFIQEASARSGALTSDQIQVAENVQPADRASLEAAGDSLLSIQAPGVVPPLSLNHAGILADPAVRKALLVGIDRQDLVDTVFDGEPSLPATSVLSSSTPYYTDKSDKLVYDPDQAKKLLDDAGWVPGADGIREKDGKTLTLVWLAAPPVSPANEYVQQAYRALGIDIQLKNVTAPEYVEQQNAGQFDITAVSVTRADPDALRNLFNSKGPNLWHLPASQLDGLLQQQVTATDPDARQAAVDAAVDWVLDNADTVPLYQNAIVHATSADAHGLSFDSSTRLLVQDAWLG